MVFILTVNTYLATKRVPAKVLYRLSDIRTPISMVLLLFAGTLAPAREIPNGGDDNDGSAGNIEDTIMYIMTNVNLIVPVVSAIAVIVIAIVVICVLRGRDNRGFPKGNAFVL